MLCLILIGCDADPMASGTMTRLSIKNPKPSRYVVPTLAHQRGTAVFASATTVRTLLVLAGNLVRQVYLLLVLLASWSFLGKLFNIEQEKSTLGVVEHGVDRQDQRYLS